MIAQSCTGSPAARRAYLRKEVTLSIVINSVLSLAFFLRGFGIDPSPPARVGRAGGYALDFLPQSFMIALMSVLVPGAITAARIRGARIGGLAETIGAVAIRSFAIALAALAVGGAIAATLVAVAGDAAVAWTPALVAKVVYGAILAAIVTPIGLRAALRRAVFH